MPRDYFWQGEPWTDIVVGCGLCDRRRGFAGLGSDGGIKAARRQGWRVEFRPKALIRCPEHAAVAKALPPQPQDQQSERDKSREAP